ncbi:MAG: redoxin domain-containing protein [Verrucomicrobia bacterium]|nr:redoxin domain-containing protein [Verrucomicrobiota bacterium]
MSENNCCCDCEPHTVTVGMDVPDFTMYVYDPENRAFGKVSLDELKKAGKWAVLVFYPADFTFVCPTELADLAEKHERIKKLGGEVISVSTDTQFAHLAWRDSEKLLARVKYLMGADPTGNVSRLFGVYDSNTGLAMRGTFLVSPQGKLACSEINFYNVGRDMDELVRRLEANVYLLAHPAEACPAKWKQGAKTLTPNEKMVGKVYEALQG